MGCLKLNLNLGILAKLFEHSTITFRRPTKRELNAE